MKTKITSLALALCAAPFANATVLLFDDFDGGGLATGDSTSINGGFELVSNGITPGTVGETPSNATITTSATQYDNTGIVSTNSIDATSLVKLQATWEISSQTVVGASSAFQTELLLQGSTAFRNTPFIEFKIEDDGEWKLYANDGGGTVTLFDGPNLAGGVSDGYTVTLDMNLAGWTVTGTGFTANPSQSGAWSGGFDFTDLQTNLYAAATIQTGSNSGVSLDVDSITVFVPEPSSAALLGLGGVALALRRRRA